VVEHELLQFREAIEITAQYFNKIMSLMKSRLTTVTNTKTKQTKITIY
jgi:predicted component of type VI protein secretion system